MSGYIITTRGLMASSAVTRKIALDDASGFTFDAPKLATDSALRIAIDEASVRSYDKDGRLRIARAHITKANVCPYRGSEIPDGEMLGLDPDRIYLLYRDPNELKKAAPTLNGVPLLRKHVQISADDHQPDEVVGSLGTDADFDGEYLDNSLFVNARSAIKGIESKKRRELSAGYHYRAEMTAGTVGDKRFDGVMRDIVFNHVALVEDGRAGPDVVVGDSMEGLMKKPTRLAALTLNMVAAHVAPMIAMDAKIELPKALFAGITTKNFATGLDALVKGVGVAMDGKTRKGVAFDDGGLKKLLSALEDTTGEAADKDASEEQIAEMEEAAEVEPVVVEPEPKPEIKPKPKGFDAEAMKEWARAKGMGEDDIAEMEGMFPKPATDEEPEDMDGEDEADPEAEEKRKAAEAAAAKDRKPGKDKTPPAFGKDKAGKDKDPDMKDMVTKSAMDAALKSTAEATAKAVRETERGIAVARETVTPWVGNLPLSMAFDSAEGVYRHALTMLGVKDAKTMNVDALLPVLNVQRRPGARPVEQDGGQMAMDADGRDELSKLFPGIEQIEAV